MPHTALALLRTIDWFDDGSECLPAPVDSWLRETGSMTRRLERYCDRLTVVPYQDGFVTADVVAEERSALPDSERYWLREVVMYGDGQPWLVGRTVMPPETLEASSSALMNIGNQPLGRYLFTQDSLARDYIHVGRSQGMWARRSLLRIAHQPLLLTELFLPASPAYLQDSVGVCKEK